MSNENMQVIEVNGIKMEVDTRHAKRIDTFRVGSKVKLLMKSSNYNDASVYSGVVVGFEPFESSPIIIVAYLNISYSTAELKFAYIGGPKKDDTTIDIVASIDDDLPIQKSDVLSKMDREILKAKHEVEDLERKRAYFLKNFNSYFQPVSA